jgi:hypothetical protein
MIEEVNIFFDNIYNIIIDKYKNNLEHEIKNELIFLYNLFSEFNYEINNKPTINLSNYCDNLIRDDLWRNYNLMDEFYNIKMFFSDGDFQYNIFLEIKKILIEENYIISQELVNYNFDYKICNGIKFKNIIGCFCIFSLNKLLYKIYSYWNKNYEECIIKKQEDYILLQEFENISQKNLSLIKLKINKYNNLEFTPKLILNNLLYYNNKFFVGSNYECYEDLYNLLNSKNNIIIDNINLLSKFKEIKITKPKTIKEETKEVIKEVIKKEVKPKKKSIPLTLKRKVWNKWIGETIGSTKCLCCKLTVITQLSFSCGHIIAEANGGEIKMDNLKPICVSCNSSMGTKNLEEFINQYGF